MAKHLRTCFCIQRPYYVLNPTVIMDMVLVILDVIKQWPENKKTENKKLMEVDIFLKNYLNNN
jgi:hypothetical protein